MNKQWIINELTNRRDDLQNQVNELQEAIEFLNSCINLSFTASEISEVLPQLNDKQQDEIGNVKFCLNCGKPFHPVKLGRMPQLYCCKSCNNQYQRKKKAGLISGNGVERMVGIVTYPDPLHDKLNEIKRTCPAPINRPAFARDFA